jgi:hypothetical protein
VGSFVSLGPVPHKETNVLFKPSFSRSLFNRHTLLPLLSLCMLIGCASTKVLFPPSPPGNGLALVYFIRIKYPPYAFRTDVWVHGRLKASIANNDFAAVNVPVGTTPISLATTGGPRFEFDMDIDRPDTMYVVVTGDITHSFGGMGYKSIRIKSHWHLQAHQVSKSDAEAMLNSVNKTLD